jgi:CDP-6-deoxy-D-xylo-4-hexulose-3-dehydrase
MIKLVNDTITKQDLIELSAWLLQDNTPQLTKGSLTALFQEAWAREIGTNYSTFVNSGSSAILLALSALQQGNYLKNNKLVVSSLSWHTDVSSPMLLGYDVILSDCNTHDLSCDLDHLEKIFAEQKPAVLILVSVLGLVPDMDRIVELCKKYDVILLEDVCESAGSSYKGQKLGTFGLASFFSFYFGHHLSTIEGGFINTSDKRLQNILLSIRNHGWDRDFSPEDKQEIRKEWGVDDFDALYKFYYSGFNLRSTDLQAFIGLRQVGRLQKYSEARYANYNLYCSLIKKNELPLVKTSADTFISSFAYPVVNVARNKIVTGLREAGVEARPLIAGSMGNQPFWIKKYGKLSLPNCDRIDKYGFYVPNNQDLTVENIKLISDIINKLGE